MKLISIYYSPETEYLMLYSSNNEGIVALGYNGPGVKVDTNPENLVKAIIRLKYELIGYFNE